MRMRSDSDDALCFAERCGDHKPGEQSVAGIERVQVTPMAPAHLTQAATWLRKHPNRGAGRPTYADGRPAPGRHTHSPSCSGTAGSTLEGENPIPRARGEPAVLASQTFASSGVGCEHCPPGITPQCAAGSHTRTNERHPNNQAPQEKGPHQ